VAAFGHVPAFEWEQLACALDSGIDDLSAEQRALAIGRALRRVDVAVLDLHDEQHLQILWDELRAAALQASLDRLVENGDLKVAGVADSGHLIYTAPVAPEHR
jgi:hypothetical protein